MTRPKFTGFTRHGAGRLEASLTLEEPRGPWGKLWRLLVGRPIHSELEINERLTKKKALAVFSSDALSSVAYAPQATLVVLLAAGAGALYSSLWISIAVVLLLAAVVFSYRQTIYAYPSGGGSYIVAHENLGEIPGLVAAAALSVGYILTVSVSIASAVDQLVSAVPTLLSLKVGLGIGAVGLVTLANLRGIRESGSIFAAPTYVFLAAMFAMVGGGMFLYFTGQLVVPPPPDLPPPTETLGLFLLLRAFAVGSAVMTGTEAISNGIPAFKPPESRNAAHTIVTMATILAIMFLGLSYLIVVGHIIPRPDETVISLLSHAVFGEGPLYYLVQASAVLILVLAANTAYADFPRLASLLARDDYAPKQLAFRGERLAFTNGILTLGVMSALLIILFAGSTEALLPLYAVAVFTAFTLSQAGMVQHWRRLRGRRWLPKSVVNGIGASATGLVTVIAAGTDFMDLSLPIVPGLPIGWGSWLVLVIVPLFIWLLLSIKSHYREVERDTALPAAPTPTGEKPLRNVVVVPIARLNRPAIQALRYAQALSDDVTAVHVATDPEKAHEMEEAWAKWGRGIPLTIVESPYRSLTRPLLQYLSELKRHEHAETVTVVLPEYVPDSIWQHLLHGQAAQFLKLSLLFTPGFVVTSVPVHPETEAELAAAAAANGPLKPGR
ncbi:MAG TPA: APC family permease [Chloroflexota bacterium]|nr:APC family permease [Chloroflexota bacterium]